MHTGAKITYSGHYVPQKVITNDDFVQMGIDTSNEWILSRTGIQTRHIASETENSSDLAYNACTMALQSVPQSLINQIDLIIVATSTPDYNGFPATACLLQEKLGIPSQCAAFDLSAACSGFSYALTTATQFIATGQSQKALVVGVDCLSKIVDWSDRNTCVLFGDGAGVVLLEATTKQHILGSQLYSNGGLSDILKVNKTIQMDGKSVFKTAVETTCSSLSQFLSFHGLSVNNINYFIPHQANIRIIESIQKKLGFTKDQTLINLTRYGNTSSASIPIAISEAAHSQQFQDGNLILTIGFGAGFTWGINLIQWSTK